MKNFTLTGCFASCLAVAAALIIAATAPAQSDNRNTMIMSDGENRYVLHFSMPDIELVVKPDLARSDARIFRDELHLSEGQLAAVERSIEEYLDAFAKLVEEKHPDPQSEDDDEAARAAEPPPPGPRGGMDASPVQAIILDELNKAGFDFKSMEDLPVQPRVEIGASMTRSVGDDGEMGPPEPSLDVAVSLGGEDDALTDEMRAKLQAALDKAVPRIAEHVKAQLSEELAQQAAGAASTSPADAINERWQEIQELRARIRTFLREKHALRSRVMNDVQTILAAEQIELWPAFERTFTRVKTLPLGVFDGESTDLIAVLDDLDLPESQMQRLTDIPLAYETQLHTALAARNDLLEEIEAEIDMALFEHDGQKARSLTGRMTRARVAVRDVNERFTELIASQLEAPSSESFRRAALAESYPRVYRPTLGEQAFKRTLELDGLNDDVRTAILALETEYRAQLDRINVRIASTIRRQQPRAPRESIDRAIALLDEDQPMGMPDPSEARDTITDDFRTRQQLDARTMRTLYSMLTPDQVALLPKIPEIDLAEPVTAEHYEPGSGEDDF
jgi:hypothetical protein